MKRIGVLFMQSQSYFGSDSMIHSLFVKNLDRERFRVFVACNAGEPGRPTPAYMAFKDIPETTVIPMNFGPTYFKTSARERGRAIAQGLPAVVDLPKLALIARRNNISIVHGTEKPRDALYGVSLAKVVRAKSVVHMHVKYHESLSGRATIALKHSDAVIGVSAFVADSVKSAGCKQEHIYSILNSIDTKDWDVDAESTIRAELNIGPSQPVIVIASRMFHWKGHTELIRAMAIVHQSRPDARLLVVGEDDGRAHPGGGSFSGELKSLVSQLGLNDAVTFTGFRPDVRAILKGSDVFAMPSFEEPCAVAYLEAMAMALPIVALRSGGTPQLVQHGVTGLLSEPGDVGGLAEHILTAINDPIRARAMGRLGRERVLQHFNPQRMTRDLEEVYGRILAPA